MVDLDRRCWDFSFYRLEVAQERIAYVTQEKCAFAMVADCNLELEIKVSPRCFAALVDQHVGAKLRDRVLDSGYFYVEVGNVFWSVRVKFVSTSSRSAHASAERKVAQ